MAYSLDQLRQLYPDVLGSLSDAAAINKISSLSGQDPQALAAHYGVINPNQGDLARGWGSGIDSAQAGLYGVAAWAMGDNVPEGSVREKVRDWGYKGYEDNMAEVQLRAKPYDTITEAESFGDVVDSAQYWLAYAGPQIIEAVLGSKGGAFVGKKAVERQVKKELKKKLGNNTGAINAVLNSKATKELVSKWSTRGSYGGIGTQAIATELGHTYGGAVDEAIAKGGTIDDVDWGRATKYGLAAGAAEFGADVLTLGLAKVGPAKNLMDMAGKGKSRVRNALTRGTTGGTLEAGTEMVQTGLEEMGAGHSFKNANFLDPTSAWAGFIGGGAMGLAGGAATKKPDTKAQIDEALEIANQESQEADQERQQQERQQQQRQQQQEQNIDEVEELRDKHSRTFPDEKTWTSEQKAEQELMDRAELADEESELSAEFKAWRKANRIHLSNNEKANDKVIKDFFKASAGSVSNQQMRDAHIAALDAHADLQVQKANRSEDQQAMINETLDEMIAQRVEALDTGNMEMLRTVEQQAIDLSAESPEFMAEWSEAKRIWAQAQAESDAEAVAETKKTKGRKTKKATEELEVTTPLTEEEQKRKDDDANVQQLNIDNQELSKEEFVKKHPSFAGVWGFPEITEEMIAEAVDEGVEEEFALVPPVIPTQKEFDAARKAEEEAAAAEAEIAPLTAEEEKAKAEFAASEQEQIVKETGKESAPIGEQLELDAKVIEDMAPPVNPWEDKKYRNVKGKKTINKRWKRWDDAVKEFGQDFETQYEFLRTAIYSKRLPSDSTYSNVLEVAKELKKDREIVGGIFGNEMRVMGQVHFRGKWQKPVIELLLDAAKRGSLHDYLYYEGGKWKFAMQDIARDSGVKSGESSENDRKAVEKALNAYRKKQILYGELSPTRETVGEFLDRTLKKMGAQQAAIEELSTADIAKKIAANEFVGMRIQDRPSDTGTGTKPKFNILNTKQESKEVDKATKNLKKAKEQNKLDPKSKGYKSAKEIQSLEKILADKKEILQTATATPAQKIKLRLAALEKRVPILKRSATFAEKKAKANPKNKDLQALANSKRRVATRASDELIGLKDEGSQEAYEKERAKLVTKRGKAGTALREAKKRLSKARQKKVGTAKIEKLEKVVETKQTALAKVKEEIKGLRSPEEKRKLAAQRVKDLEAKKKGELPEGTPTPEFLEQQKKGDEEAVRKAKEILSNEGARDDVAGEWDAMRSKDMPTFDKLTEAHKFEWAAIIATAINEDNYGSIDVLQNSMEGRIRNEETYSKPETKDQKVDKGSSTKDTTKEGSGAAADTSGQKDSKSKPTIKPTIKEASAYAKEKLGKNWRTKYPRLPKLLRGKGKNLPAFNRLVDKYAEEVITTQDELTTVTPKVTMENIRIDAMNMSKEEFSKNHPEFASEWDVLNAEKPTPKVTMENIRIDAMNMNKEEFSKKYPEFAGEWDVLNAEKPTATEVDYESLLRDLDNLPIEAIALVDEKVNAPTDRATMEGLFLKMLGPEVYNRIKHRIFYYETVKEAEKIHSRAASGSAVVTKSYKGHSPSGDRTYPGFRERGKKAAPDTMSFILENIPRGSELATFMHEIGSHIGLDNILSPRESTALVKKIRTWAQEYAQVGKGKANTEQTAAAEAIRQVEVLKMMRAVETTIPVNKDSRIVTEETTSEDHEIIAYFITNAVVLHGETKGRLGVIPQSTELGKVLHKFRLAFRKFIGYMKGETDNLNAQNIVDMAFGAAKLELDGGGYDIYHQGTIGAMDRYRRTFDYMESLRSEVPGGTVTPASKGISIPIYASGSSKEYAGEWNYDKLKAMTSYMTKSPWSDKIDAFVARRFPKNERGKYIHTSYLSKEEYIKFQKEQWAAEKKLRAGLKAEVAKRQRDAARHEKDMYDPDNISTEESYEMDPEEKKQSDREASETRDWIRNKWGITATKIWDSLVELWRGGANSTKFLHQFINQVKKIMPAAKEWYRHILLSEKTRNEIKEVIDKIVVLSRDMSEARLNKVNLFLAKSTIDQKWGYNPYAEGDPRFEKVVVDKEMRIAFNKLDKRQKELVQEIFKHGIVMRARKQEIAERIFGKSDKFKRAKEEFFGASGLDGPYAPLRRFGSHVVELKSQKLLDAEAVFAEKDSQINWDKMMVLKRQKKHYELSFHDSIPSAKAKVDANKSKFAYAVVSEKAKTITEGRAVDHNVLQKVLASLGAVDHNGEPILDPKSREYKAVVDMVNNMYLESLEDENARRSQVKREGFHGYEGNMVRSFVSHATAEANLIANMEHGKDINTALIEAKKSIKMDADGNLRDGNTIERLSKVYNMLVSHYSANLNNKPTPYQDRLAAMNTVYMLTSSIGYHITNATQPIMVTIPKLVGDFGAGNYTKALKLYYQGLKIASEVVTFNWKNLKFQTQIDLDNLSKEHKKYEPLLRELQLRQLLDVGMEQDLAEFNRSDSGFEIVNKATGKASSIAHRLYQVARMVEAYNRISTATAAFELAEANKAKVAKMGYYENSTEYAINMVEDTQGNFSAMDAPLILKKAPKITGQYRKYQIMMAWVYADAFKKATVGATPHEKAAGQRTMGLMVGHAALFSGMTGVPFASAISYLFMAMGEGEEPEDLERWIHENIEDETLATLIAHGLPSIFGIDMTTKLSQDKIFYPLPYTDFSTEDGKVQEAFFEAFSGPFGTTLTNFFRGYNFAKEGNAYRAMEYMLPKGARTAMESYRLGTEGYSLRNGDVITDDFSVWQLAVNAVGIPTTDIKHLKWKRGQQYELTKWFGDRQSEIRKKYVKAKKDRNNSKMKELRLEWIDLQKSKDRVRPFFHNERSALKRTPISSLFKAPRGQEKREDKYRKQLGVD